MQKARLNYWLDGVIAMAFMLSALSGMVFMVAGSGGYQGGHNATFQTAILGLSRWVWSDVHTWSSLIMIAGVLLHLVLHWEWILCMTRKAFAKSKPVEDESCPVTA